ncbi:MAG: hypothetical protein AAB635_01055 [Patescibacteria group bacterium]
MIETNFMTIQNIIVSVGIPAIVIALIYIGRKLQVLDSVERTVESIRDRFIIVEERVKTLWKDEVATAHSPRRLNERGNNILGGSGIKEIIEAKKDGFLTILKTMGLKNPYDAEQCTLQIVNELKKDTDIVEKLKTGAFSVEADIDTVLLVGGLHLRDLIFPELGFSLDDLDKPKNHVGI